MELGWFGREEPLTKEDTNGGGGLEEDGVRPPLSQGNLERYVNILLQKYYLHKQSNYVNIHLHKYPLHKGSSYEVDLYMKMVGNLA